VAIRPEPGEGQRLSDLPFQDSYSYELTDIVIGAQDEAELIDKYERTVAALRYRLTVYTPLSSLVLPVRPITSSAELPAPSFGGPEGTVPLRTTQVRPGEYRWRVSRDLVDYTSALEVVKDTGAVRYDDIDLEVVRRAHERYSWIATTSAQRAGRASGPWRSPAPAGPSVPSAAPS
jgi:hypothetical protein